MVDAGALIQMQQPSRHLQPHQAYACSFRRQFKTFLGLTQGQFNLFALGDVGGKTMPQQAAVDLPLRGGTCLHPKNAPVRQHQTVFAKPRLKGVRSGAQTVQVLLFVLGVHHAVGQALFRVWLVFGFTRRFDAQHGSRRIAHVLVTPQTIGSLVVLVNNARHLGRELPQ